LTRLRVALETQFTVGTPTGLGVYAGGLASALRRRDDLDLVELLDPRFDLWRFDRRVYWDQFRAASLCARADADVTHFTGGTLPVFARRPIVLTVHDLVWMRGANRGRFYVRWYFGALQAALARHADAIIVDTNAARADVADGLGIDDARISVVGVGVDEAYFGLERRPVDPPYVLCVGTVEQRKGLATAVRALARVPDLRLVSAGPFTPYADEVRAAAAECGVSDRVELRGYVDDATLQALYARASLLVFPSRYEGFGLPPLQALACGLPVAASRIDVVEEVLGDCATYAPPGDVAGFAEAYATILAGRLGDRVERGRARARTYSWASVADRVVAVYRAVVGRP
jgi:glycosyltransferase involved in cell wall biosynthesis